jgi:hypothetical protein
MTRIDSIVIELDTYSTEVGRRTIRVPVALDDEMVPAIERRWQAYADELMKLAGTSTNLGFL